MKAPIAKRKENHSFVAVDMLNIFVASKGDTGFRIAFQQRLNLIESVLGQTHTLRDSYYKGAGPIVGPTAGRTAHCGPTDSYPFITATGESSVTILTRSVWLAITSSISL